MEQERQGNLWAALSLGLIFAAAAVWAAEATGVALFGADDADVTAKIEAEAADRKAMRPCDITIAQFGPGERWYRHHDVYECVTAARELPSHVFTLPLVKR